MNKDWDLESANVAFRNGVLQEWIESYLQVEDWQNLGLLRRVRAYSSRWLPPQEIGIALLSRIAGPSLEYKFPQDPVEWERAVQVIVDSNPTMESLPPVIAWREFYGEINLADGNHRVDALASMGFTICWVLLHDGPLRGIEEITRRQSSLRIST